MNVFVEVAYFTLALAWPFGMAIGVSALIDKLFGGKR